MSAAIIKSTAQSRNGQQIIIKFQSIDKKKCWSLALTLLFVLSFLLYIPQNFRSKKMYLYLLKKNLTKEYLIGEECRNEWCGPMSDEEYGKLK